MKISIEFKQGKYTVTYGKAKGTGSSVKEAVDALVNSFRTEVERFFIK